MIIYMASFSSAIIISTMAMYMALLSSAIISSNNGYLHGELMSITMVIYRYTNTSISSTCGSNTLAVLNVK